MSRVYLLILLLLTLPATAFLFRPGEYWNMHDDMQMVRQLELEKCLLDGQIPCRWVPDLGFGYGYPLFNFYPPFPYFVGQVFRLFSFSFVATVKLTAITQIIASSLTMFLLASSLFGNLGGLIAALFYVYAPYHALNIFVRGAMNEAWASVFFPLIFYFGRRLINKPQLSSIFFLAISYAGILLSHNPMALIIAPFFFLWCLYFFIRQPRTKTILYLFLSGVLAISLSAFYTLPVLLETKYVQIESMFQNYYHFSVHFTTLFQLFISNFWGDGASVWGTEDNMSFAVGYLHWIIPVLILGYLIFYSLKKHKRHPHLILVSLIFTMALTTLFMTHNKSTPIWLLAKFIQKIQFPWRFLNLSVFFTSLLVGVLGKLSRPITIIVIPALIILNLRYFTPLTHGPITDQQKFSGQSWTYQITSGIYDYLPKTARIAAQSKATEFIDQTDPKTSYQLTGQKHGTDWLFFNLSLPQTTTVTMSQLAFPKFVITDNGRQINYQIEPELGRMVISLPAGTHQLYLKLHNTPVRTFSNIVSCLAILLVVIYFSLRHSTSWINKK